MNFRSAENGSIGADWSTPMETVFGGWQFNATHTVQSGLPFNVGYANSSSDRDTGPGRPNLIGDPEGDKTRDTVVQHHAHRGVRECFR